MTNRRCPYCGRDSLQVAGSRPYACCIEMVCGTCGSRLVLYLETVPAGEPAFDAGVPGDGALDRSDP